MNALNLKKIEIMSNLSFVPTEKLEEIDNFIKYILYATNVKQKKPVSVRGIWAGKGFEKIDIEKELKTLRKDLQDKLDKKEII